tara:strand:- start:30 stop:269 length:240 start_codon:yes stop_codon:yes gene_type:complete
MLPEVIRHECSSEGLNSFSVTIVSKLKVQEPIYMNCRRWQLLLAARSFQAVMVMQDKLFAGIATRTALLGPTYSGKYQT